MVIYTHNLPMTVQVFIFIQFLYQIGTFFIAYRKKTSHLNLTDSQIVKPSTHLALYFSRFISRNRKKYIRMNYENYEISK